MYRIGVACPLRERRQYDHSDWTITRFRVTRAFALIPGDEYDAPIQVCLRGENRREILCKPGIALFYWIHERRAGVVHVIAQVRCDEVVTCHRLLLYVCGQLRKGTYVRNTGGRVGIIGIGDIIEEDHRIVLGCVLALVRERANAPANALLIRLPWDTSPIQQADKVQCRVLMIETGRGIVRDAKMSPGLQPEIVRLAGMDTWRVVVLLCVGCLRKERLVDVGCRGTVHDV